jgi:hypothetical protein
MKRLLGKAKVCKKSGFLDENPKRDNRFQVIEEFQKE